MFRTTPYHGSPERSEDSGTNSKTAVFAPIVSLTKGKVTGTKFPTAKILY